MAVGLIGFLSVALGLVSVSPDPISGRAVVLSVI